MVTCPKVYRQASASRVLTLEYLDGVSLSNLEAVKQYFPEPEVALIASLNTWVGSVLQNDWCAAAHFAGAIMRNSLSHSTPPTHLRFHADVHAGNLLALSDGRVAFIDFGIVGRIPPATAEGMLDFVRAFPLGDMGGVAAALTKMGFTKDMSDAEAERFARQLQEVLEAVEDVDPNQLANGVVDDSSLNRLVASVGEVADGNGIRFPREFALLVKQVLYFDRFTKILAPELDVMADERMVMNKPPPETPVAGVVSPTASAADVVIDAEVSEA